MFVFLGDVLLNWFCGSVVAVLFVCMHNLGGVFGLTFSQQDVPFWKAVLLNFTTSMEALLCYPEVKPFIYLGSLVRLCICVFFVDMCGLSNASPKDTLIFPSHETILEHLGVRWISLNRESQAIYSAQVGVETSKSKMVGAWRHPLAKCSLSCFIDRTDWEDYTTELLLQVVHCTVHHEIILDILGVCVIFNASCIHLFVYLDSISTYLSIWRLKKATCRRCKRAG